MVFCFEHLRAIKLKNIRFHGRLQSVQANVAAVIECGQMLITIGIVKAHDAIANFVRFQFDRHEFVVFDTEDPYETGRQTQRDFTAEHFRWGAALQVAHLPFLHTLNGTDAIFANRSEQFESGFFVHFEEAVASGHQLEVDRLVGNVRIRAFCLQIWERVPLRIFTA